MKITLKVISGPHIGRDFTFDRPDTFLIGRTSEAHLSLPNDRYFSRHHCLIEIVPPQCFLRDLGSTNGTYVNSRQVHSTYLRNGDRIQGGETTLLVSASDDGPAPETSAQFFSSEASVECLNCGLLCRVDRPADGGEITFICEDCRNALKSTPQPVPGYEMVRMLGQGGMGTVMLARGTQNGQAVAIKTLLPETAVNEQSLQRFLREIKVVSALEHPNIVRYIEHGAHRGVIYLVSEYVDGNDASKVLKIRGGRLSWREVGSIVAQMLDALAYAHGKDFVHRDIKDQNILIQGHYPELKVKLTDFGLAKSFRQTGLSGVTMVGDVAGTIAYMPPEQVRDFRNVRPTSDIYSTGMTAYSLLTGRHALNLSPKAGIAETIKAIFEYPSEPIRSHVADVPQAFADVIEKALAKEPEKRWGSAAEMKAALLRAVV
jgi:eukaryotic-like serine/threonine-protein kinase